MMKQKSVVKKDSYLSPVSDFIAMPRKTARVGVAIAFAQNANRLAPLKHGPQPSNADRHHLLLFLAPAGAE